MKTTKSITLLSLASGTYAGCTVVKVKGRGTRSGGAILVKTADGVIRSLRHHRFDVDLCEPYESSDDDRRAYAKLAGIPAKSLQDEAKRRRVERLKEEKAAAINRAVNLLLKSGYTVKK